jgi:hypothetical protein
METEKMIFLRSFLFKTFLVGILFAIIVALLTFALRGAFMPLATSVFRVEEAEVNELFFAFFLNVRLVLLFLILAPAVALHWMIRSKGN